jgi:hypothetical protein
MLGKFTVDIGVSKQAVVDPIAADHRNFPPAEIPQLSE